MVAKHRVDSAEQNKKFLIYIPSSPVSCHYCHNNHDFVVNSYINCIMFFEMSVCFLFVIIQAVNVTSCALGVCNLK
jgi:hypothetical protein